MRTVAGRQRIQWACPRLSVMTESSADRPAGASFAELDSLPTEELRERAFELARSRRDVGFFWELLQHLPNADEAEALDGAPNSVGPTIDEAVALWRNSPATGTRRPSPCCELPSSTI